MNALTVKLEPAGPGAPLGARLKDAKADLSGLVALEVIAVDVRLTRQPAASPVAIRLALKRLARQYGLRASWASPPPRPAKRRRASRTLRGDKAASHTDTHLEG